LDAAPVLEVGQDLAEGGPFLPRPGAEHGDLPVLPGVRARDEAEAAEQEDRRQDSHAHLRYSRSRNHRPRTISPAMVALSRGRPTVSLPCEASSSRASTGRRSWSTARASSPSARSAGRPWRSADAPSVALLICTPTFSLNPCRSRS